MLVNGVWTADWQPVQAADDQGRFVRQTSSFRHWVTPDGAPGPTGSGGFKAAPGRYHLYAALICPWACRILMARVLKGLTDQISVSIVDPALTDQGWAFGGRGQPDPHLGAEYMHQIYTASDPHYTGRATVPVLWDKQTRQIVNNESADILAMLDSWPGTEPTLRPAALVEEIDRFNAPLYDGLNNGVYRAGFAGTQGAYEEAVRGVFTTLDAIETRLTDGRAFVHGDQITDSDIRLFVTLIRFDPAYHGLFKCNLRRLADYPRLSAFVTRVLAIPGVAATVDIAHIKAGYYSIKALNPGGIVPMGPIPALGAA